MQQDEVRTERRQTGLWIAIDRPHRRNTLTDAVINAIADAIGSAQDDGTIRSIVITGAGDVAFCAGRDLKTDQRGIAPSGPDPSRSAYADLLALATHSNKPLIARINGLCMGGGMGLAGMCDIVVAVDEASFALPEARVGLFPFQVAAVLQDKLSRALLSDMALTGRRYTATDLQRAGFIAHIASRTELDDTIDALAAAIAEGSPAAVAAGRKALAAMSDMRFEERLELARREVAVLSAGPESVEGRLAFREKRKPSWTP